MLRTKVTKWAKVMFAGMTMALCVAAMNPTADVKADEMLTETEPNESPAQANILPVNTWMSGKIEKISDQDWYQVTIPQKGISSIEIKPSADNPRADARWNVYMYDEDRNPLRSFSNGNGKGTVDATFGWKPGTYYLRVKYGNSNKEKGKYDLMLHYTATDQWESEQYHSNKSPANANVMAVDQEYIGSIYSNADADYYKVNLKGTNGATVRFAIDDSVGTRGTWKIELLEYNNTGTRLSAINRAKDVWGMNISPYYVSANDTFVLPKFSGSLLIKVKSYNNAVGKPYHLQVSDMPAKVTIKSVKAGSRSRQVSVRWGKVSNVTGYYVYRSTTPNGTYKKIATVNGATQYIDKKSLKKNKTYYYKVVAFRSANALTNGRGCESDAAWVTIRK